MSRYRTKPNTRMRLFTGGLVFFLSLLLVCPAGFALTAIITTPFVLKIPTQVTGISPRQGASDPGGLRFFATMFVHPRGAQNIYHTYFLIGSAQNTADGALLYYNNLTDKLYVRDDAGTGWLGGATPGAAVVLENALVKVDCQRTQVRKTGPLLMVTWAVEFKEQFASGISKDLCLRVVDSSGRPPQWLKQGSWVVNFGKTIGPAGGEVSSFDNSIKIRIPAGALTANTFISIHTLTTASLQGAAPENTNLLRAVECKPYNLTFQKPVELAYTLEAAEVPGTSITLGLYDGVRQVFTPLAESAAVQKDSLTVSFGLTHFSTYGALKGYLPQGGPIGAGVKIPLPDMLTGAFGHAIPLTVPPGRKGMQPSLALNYRSGSGNSWVGVGVSLNPGYIVRSTRLGPPTYNDTQDTFYFITDAGTTELVHLIDNLYQSKIESSFTKFFKEADDSWKVVGKDGSVIRFGQTAEAKETSSSGTFAWYVTRAIDTNGNYVSYSYIKDAGKAYLSRIEYTGNQNTGFSPTNSVEFFLEPRDDIASSYISSAKIATAKRLKEVQAKVNGDLVWRYELEYTYSPDTNRSLLESVVQSGADGKNLPKQSLEYQRSEVR